MGKSKKLEELNSWFEELVFPGKVKDFLHEIKNFTTETGEECREVKFYTNDHCYRIFAVDRKDSDYLGCQVSTRKMRPGEDWFRGNDLPDGPINRKTWDRILRGIVNYELILLSKYKKPKDIPEGA